MDPNQYPQPNQVPEPVPGPAPLQPQAPTPAQQPQPLPQPSPVPQPVQPQPQFQPQAQPQPQSMQQPEAHHFFGPEQATAPQPAPVTPSFAATPTTPSKAAHNPGAGFGLASLILCLVGLGLFGLIFGVIGLKKSRRAGMKNPLALVGIILGSLEIVAGIIAIVLFSTWLSLVFSTCQELGTGTHVLTDGRSLTCSV